MFTSLGKARRHRSSDVQLSREKLYGSTNHKRVHNRVRGCAGPFSTNVDENWAIIFIPELVVHPVTLLVGFIHL